MPASQPFCKAIIFHYVNKTDDTSKRTCALLPPTLLCHKLLNQQQGGVQQFQVQLSFQSSTQPRRPPRPQQTWLTDSGRGRGRSFCTLRQFHLPQQQQRRTTTFRERQQQHSHTDVVVLS